MDGRIIYQLLHVHGAKVMQTEMHKLSHLLPKPRVES